jgi:hypothetical protein
LDYHFLLARDLCGMRDLDYERLTKALLELRKMTTLVQKIDADRSTANC